MNPFFQRVKALEALAEYAPNEQKLLQVFAAMYAPLYLRDLKAVMQALGWGASFLNKSWLDKAVMNGLLERVGTEYNISREILEYLNQQLALSGDYTMVIRIAEKTVRRSCSEFEKSRDLRTQRLSLYSGDVNGVRSLLSTQRSPFTPCAEMPLSWMHITHTIIDWVWLNSLPDDLKFQFLYHIIYDIGAGRVHSFYLSDVRSVLEDSPAILQESAGACLLASVAIWQGDMQLAKSLMPQEKCSDSLALRGRLAFLQGHYMAAFEWYRMALIKKRKECGICNIGLKGEDMILQIFACLGSKRASEAFPFILSVRKCRVSRSDQSFITRLLENMLEERIQDKTWPDDALSKLLATTPENPFSVLCISLSLYWVDRQPENIPDFMANILQAEYYTKSHQMHWLTWEFNNLPRSQALTASASALALAQTSQVQNDDPEQFRLALQQMQANKLISCLNIFPQEMAWERSLQALKLLTEISKPTVSKTQRLVWLFVKQTSWNDSLSTHKVEPRLQNLNKNGRWSKGRRVAIARLLPSSQRQEDFPFLTEQDKLICDRITSYNVTHYGYYSEEISLDANDALAAASNHPHLFINDVDTSLRVTHHDVALKVEHEQGQIHLSIDPFPDEQTFSKMEGKERDRTEIRWQSEQHALVYHYSADHLRIARILGKDGLLVPESAKERALESVAAIAPLLTVFSEVDGAGQQTATQVEPDSRLHLHLQPVADGLHIACFVRPFGAAPLLLHPAEGEHTIFTEFEGNTLQTRRDLAREAALAKAMFSCCLLLDIEEKWDWQLQDPQAALETLESLNSLGDDVVLEWPEGRAITMAKRMDVAQFRVSMHAQQDWFEIEADVEIGEDQVLGLKHLLDLVQASPGRFIRLGQDQFLSLSKALYQRLDTLQSITDQGRFHALAATAIEELTDGMHVRKNRNWQSHLQKLSDAQNYQPELPSTLQAELRDYQLEGFQWMSRLSHWGAGACLADDMGLGKTVQALALILSHAELGPTLVIAPTSVCINWKAETARFAPTLNVADFSEGKRTEMIRDAGPFDLIVCSYALLQRNAKILIAKQWQTVVLDEAQAIKNALSKRSKAAMDLQAQVRLITTGTPIENHLGELWTLFQFINPGLLGSLEKFNHRFANPIQQNHDKEASRRLKKLIQPFILRRLKSDVLPELPSRTEITLHVDLSGEEMALYEATRRQALERIEQSSDEHAGTQHIRILAEIMRLRRACCHPSLVMPNTHIEGSKLAAFGECVEELMAGHHKALVFSQFVGHLNILREYLDNKGISYQYLDGSTPAKKRQQSVNAFQAGKGDLFLISLKAGGAGLNLTAADYVLHMDPWWNPAVEDQASDRAHRIGQTRPVTIYRFIAKGTIEDKIVQLHQHKRALADNLLEGSDSGGKLSLQEIIKLVEDVV